MKITAPHAAEGTDPNSRKRRLETVLSAWRMPRLVYWAEPATPPRSTMLSGQEQRLWLEILRVAEPVPPRHDLQGLKVYARLRGIRIEDLVRDNAVLIVDDRVAFRGHLHGFGLLGHSWSLLLPAQIAGQATQLRRRLVTHRPPCYAEAL